MDPPAGRGPRRRLTGKDWAFGIAVASVAIVWGVGQVHAFIFQLHLFR